MSSRDFGFTTLRNMTAYQPNGAIVPQNYILTTSTNGNAVFTNSLNLSTINLSTLNSNSINTSTLNAISIITSTISTTAIYDASGNVGLPGQLLTSDGSEAFWSTISGGSGLPAGTNWADYLYWDNISNSWVVSTDRVRLLQNAGQTGQQSGAVAIGLNAGNTDQNTNAIAIGNNAASTSQGIASIAIGWNAGLISQNQQAIALGISAGQNMQNTGTVAIGIYAGQDQQDINSIAIGYAAGTTQQQQYSIAIGQNCGNSMQGDHSIAIGRGAGATTQGSNAIAIGTSAGLSNQHSNSIILNAQGVNLDSQATDSCYIAPIRNLPNSNILLYNTTTKEITYNNSIDVSALNVSSINGLSYPPLDDALWSNDGAGNIYNDNSGNVGIGLTAPEFKLDVFGCDTGYGSVRITQSTSAFFSTDPALQIQNNNTVTPRYINFFTNLDASDYNPICNTNDKAIVFSDGSENTGNMWIGPWSDSTAGIKILSSGNVGIGLGAPEYTLDVFGSVPNVGSVRIAQSTSAFNTIHPALKIQNNNESNENCIKFCTNLNNGSWNPICSSSDKAIIFSDGSENTGNMWIGPWSDSTAGIKILSNGNVGIGIQQPQYDLDVNGNIFTNSAFLISTSAANAIRLTTDSSNSYIQSGTSLAPGSRNTLLFTPIDSNTTTMAVDLSNMRVGINTVTPAYTLDVNSTGRIPTLYSSTIYDINNSSGTTGQVLTANSSGNIVWSAPTFTFTVSAI